MDQRLMTSKSVKIPAPHPALCARNWRRLGLCALMALATNGEAEDWPMLGRDRTRNPVSPEKGAPVEWDVKSGRNIKWTAPLGGVVVPQPIVAKGLVWVGTNNEKPLDPARPGLASVLGCWRERDGQLLHLQYFGASNNVTRLARRHYFGMTASPLAEEDRLWLVSPMAEILCLDTGAFGRGQGPPKLVWRIDLEDALGVFAALDFMGGRGLCSIGSSYGDWIYVATGNGVDWSQVNVPVPLAPDLLCLHKQTGEVVWEDSSPGDRILKGEFASPLIMEIAGAVQVIAPQGDGWIRSFEAKTGRLLWKFDINPIAVKKKRELNFFLNSPVLYEGRIYIACGRDVESGIGPGRLVCIDPTRRGDLSLELQVAPGVGKPNPNAGAIWHFDQIGRTMANVAVAEGLVVAVDLKGVVYCLDAATGGLFWKHDSGARIWGNPLIVDGKIYVGNEDGRVSVLELSRTKQLLFTSDFETCVFASPVFANGVLYIASNENLFAIQTGARSPPRSTRNKP